MCNECAVLPRWAAGALGRVCESKNGHSSKCSGSNYPNPSPGTR